VNHTTPEIYAGNHNFATYQIEHDAKIDTSYTLYNREAVERLMRDNPEVLPPAGKKVSQAIAEGKAVAWDKQKLQSVMIQGILQGDSIPHLAERLARTVGDSDMKASIRNARTMATRAQNAGRVDAYKRAQDKGVELEQMWLATMDNRTRHSHRYLDGETRPLGEAFSNGCEYPADPKGDPAEIYNCRCSLRGVVKGLDRRSGQFRDDSEVGGMSYEEWRNAKPQYRDILSQKEKGEAIKRAYIREYGGYGSKKSNDSQAITTNTANIPNVQSNPRSQTENALTESYTYHQNKNNLTLVPLSELGEYTPIEANYGKISEEMQQHFSSTISNLASKYDTPLQKVRVMTKEEYMVMGGKDVFARVEHNYDVDSAQLIINPAKCSKQDKLVDRMIELRNKGYIPKIKDGTEADYIATHEFAHTLIDMGSELDKKRNWAGADYKRIENIRKEIDGVYNDYLAEVKKAERNWKDSELKAMTSFDQKDWDKAAHMRKEYDDVKVSNYSLVNSDEFMAECFALDKLGDNNNKYALKVMEIVDRCFKR
jgi:SPP1 gp7 family putative phage head morphogenesis protein